MRSLAAFPGTTTICLWQWSPLRYVRQAQTPTLFIHGEQDNDVHITQAEEMYMALKRRGVETVLVRYPREGHGLREPRHRVDVSPANTRVVSGSFRSESPTNFSAILRQLGMVQIQPIGKARGYCFWNIAVAGGGCQPVRCAA